MPSPKTAVTLSRIAAICFALTAGMSLVSGYSAYQQGERPNIYIARTVL